MLKYRQLNAQNCFLFNDSLIPAVMLLIKFRQILKLIWLWLTRLRKSKVLEYKFSG